MQNINNHKPKICFVCQNIYPLLDRNRTMKFVGGAELQQLMIGKELSKRGYSVSYVTMDHGQDMVTKIGNFNVLSTYKPEHGVPILRFIYPRLVKTWNALNISDADIYYVRCAGHILAPVVYFSRLNNKKVVFSGANEPDFEPEKLTSLKLDFRDRIMYFWGLKRCDAVVVQNRSQQNNLLKNFNRESLIIHNGFPKDSLYSSFENEILWVGTFKTEKNPKIFVDLARKFPNERFVMIGGNLRRNNSLEEFVADEANNIPNLVYKGFLPLIEVEKHFLRAKLLINTSSFEGFPNTFLQAWRRGIPVVSFVNPDNLITENHLGVVVKDIDDMIKNVKEILNNNIMFSYFKIKKFFDQNLTIGRAVDRYESLIYSLIY